MGPVREMRRHCDLHQNTATGNGRGRDSSTCGITGVWSLEIRDVAK